MKLLDLTQPDLDALVEERDRLHAALEAVERVDREDGWRCSRCGAKWDHDCDCLVGLALGRPECTVREPGR